MAFYAVQADANSSLVDFRQQVPLDNRDQELVIWWTRGGIRKFASEQLGRDVTDEEVDLVADFYNESDYGEAEHFAEAVHDCTETLLRTGEIKKEG